MRESLKHIFYHLPRPLRRTLLRLYESFHTSQSITRLKEEGVTLPRNKKIKVEGKLNILFYHISGLSFGGTEKFLQILAKHINKEKYHVYFMYSLKNTNGNRLSYLEGEHIELIEFNYEESESKYPYFIKGMKPSILNIIEEKKIDLVVTPGSGFNQFPLNVIKNIPIFVLNIFGSPNTQTNIINNICISHEVADKIRSIVNEDRIKVMYIPSEKPSDDYVQKGMELRTSLGLKETDMVFGRIGRADDNIFDPIAIEAFKKIVREFPHAYFLIQSPAPMLVKKVKDEMIPNVLFLEPTSNEEKIWSFHFAIDALAHSRADGESCGLNIIESMIAGKPIISHKSPIWNAHLEYLEPSFSRVAGKADSASYAESMREFIKLKQNNELKALGQKAEEKSKMFLIENNIDTFESWIDDSKSAIF